MKGKIAALVLLCMMLSGCSSWMQGEYHTVKRHEEKGEVVQQEMLSASNYMELRSALAELVASGTENSVISVEQYDRTALTSGMEMAVHYARDLNPVGAYAVRDIQYEIGTSTGKPAVAVEITYRYGPSQVRKIRWAEDMEEATQIFTETLDECQAGVAIYIENYEQVDFSQMTEDYAEDYPDRVMERPRTTVNIYPNNGQARVVELTFSYENSREALRQMQDQVRTVFSSAALYVSGDGQESQKFYQLYAFLTERFDYKQATSITPAYSLLRHGVGDSRAFAMVYAAMCRQAGLDCQVVTGTRDGEAWYWNIIREGETYYHVDLIRSNLEGKFTRRQDSQMTEYVWDYSAYPACQIPTPPPEETDPAVTGELPEEGRTEAPQETAAPTE